MKFNVITNPLGPLFQGLAYGFSLKKNVGTEQQPIIQYNIRCYTSNYRGQTNGVESIGVDTRDVIYEGLIADGWESYTPAPFENISVHDAWEDTSVEPSVWNTYVNPAMLHSIGLGPIAMRIATPPTPRFMARTEPLLPEPVIVPLLTNPNGIWVWV